MAVKLLLAIIVSFAIIIPILGISIDSQLVNTKKECFVRVALGERLPPPDTTRRVDTPNLAKCEDECSIEMNRCLSFSFGISPKGNGTCELSIREIMPSETKIKGSITDPDFDVYSKRYNCDSTDESRDPFVSPRPRPDPIFEEEKNGDYRRPSANSGYSQSSSQTPSSSYDNSNSNSDKPSGGYNERPPRPYETGSPRPSYNKPSYGSSRPSEGGNSYGNSYRPPPGWREPYAKPSEEGSYGNDIKPSYGGNSRPYEEPYRPHGGSSYNDRPYPESQSSSYGSSSSSGYDDSSWSYSNRDKPYNSRPRPSDGYKKPFVNPYENEGSTSGTYYDANDDYYDDRDKEYDRYRPSLYDTNGYSQVDKYGDRMQWSKPKNPFREYQNKGKYPMSYGEQYSYDRYGSTYSEGEKRYYSKKPSLEYDSRDYYGDRHSTYGNAYGDYRPSTYNDKPLGPSKPLYEDNYYNKPDRDNVVYGDKIAVSHGSSGYGSSNNKPYGTTKRPPVYDSSYRGNGYDNLPGKYNYENRNSNRDKGSGYGDKDRPDDRVGYGSNQRPDDRGGYGSNPKLNPNDNDRYGSRPDPEYRPDRRPAPGYATSQRPSYMETESPDDRYMTTKPSYISKGDQESNSSPGYENKIDSNKPAYQKPYEDKNRPDASYGSSNKEPDRYSNEVTSERPYDKYPSRYGGEASSYKPYGEQGRPSTGYGNSNNEPSSYRPYDRPSYRPSYSESSYSQSSSQASGYEYNSRPDPGYGSRPDDKYPPRPDNAYPPRPSGRPDSGYSSRPDGGYMSRPDGRYPPRPDNGYESRPEERPDPGYGPRPDDSYRPKPGGGYRPQPSERPDDGYRPRPSERPDTGYKPRPSERPDDGYRPRPSERPDEAYYKPDERPKPDYGDRPGPQGPPRPIPYDVTGEWYSNPWLYL